jgi:benzoyl-CoA reductase/2-hydroxyglutaryl-CoA dehydratase subunit BcrC/BadD/HgdB
MTNETISRRIVYSCAFVPAEWIHAHGFAPSRVAPVAASTALTGQMPGACPYALAFANEAAMDSGTAAVIFTTACDQMRRVADLVTAKSNAPVFVMTLPHTWQTAEARELYLSELERLGRFMVALGGQSPGRKELAQTMLEHDEFRASVRSMRQRLSPKQYSQLIMRFHKDRSVDHPPPSPEPKGLSIALVGGPLMSGDLDIFDMIEAAGGRVALDGTETGERTLPAAFDRQQMQDDPLGALADCYFGHIQDAFRRPNDGFYEWLKQRMTEESVRGIILRRYIWCDIWHAEAERLKEQTGLPVLHLDVTDDGADSERTSYRLQSFMEMLK